MQPKGFKLEARHKFVKNAKRSIHILLTFYLETSIFRQKQKKVERRYITNYRGARRAQKDIPLERDVKKSDAIMSKGRKMRHQKS